MTKVLRLTAMAASVAALALTATQAAAAPVNATSNATAKARILKPLVLASTANFDLGIIVLAGAGAYTATVSLDRANTFNCDGNSGNVHFGSLCHNYWQLAAGGRFRLGLYVAEDEWTVPRCVWSYSGSSCGYGCGPAHGSRFIASGMWLCLRSALRHK